MEFGTIYGPLTIPSLFTDTFITEARLITLSVTELTSLVFFRVCSAVTSNICMIRNCHGNYYHSGNPVSICIYLSCHNRWKKIIYRTDNYFTYLIFQNIINSSQKGCICVIQHLETIWNFHPLTIRNKTNSEMKSEHEYLSSGFHHCGLLDHNAIFNFWFFNLYFYFNF
jgi:hypothetical protein